MSHDYQRKRILEKIDDLKKEQGRLVHAIMRNRREEQFELDRLRREFTTRNNAITHRQEAIEKELRDKQREYERIEHMIEEDRKRSIEVTEEEELERKRKHRY